MSAPNVLDHDAFAALIATLAGLNVTNVNWDPITPDFAMIDPESATKITLSLFGLSALGVDEHRTEFEPPGYPAQALVTTEIGNREVTINMMVEVYDRGIEAAEIIDRIRTGIRAEASTASLDAMLLALEWVTPTTPLRMTREQRTVSAATADFRFGGIAQQVSAVKLGYGWVDQIDSTPITKPVIPGTFTP
jgi:hypothetical protein